MRPRSHDREAKSVLTLQMGREDPTTVSLAADVVVFGAGIAGLTAAHELAERNFRVAVVDPDIREEPLYSTSPDDDNPGLGGMARTQWRYLYNVAARLHITQLPSAPSTTLRTKDRPFRPFVVDWHLTRDDLRAADLDSRLPVGFHERCDQVRKMLREHPIRAGEHDEAERPFEVTLAVTPRPLDDDEFEVVRGEFTRAVQAAAISDEQKRRVLGHFDFANFAAYIAVWETRWDAILLELDGVDEATVDAIDRAYDYEAVIGTVMTRKVAGGDAALGQRLFHVMLHDQVSEPGKAFVEPNTFVLPGEHGFRFFPSFYRHLFDLMRRTPRMKPRQRTGAREFVRAERGTVFDNLVPAERLVLSSTSPWPSIKLLRRDGFTLERVRELIHGLLREARYSERDLLRLSTAFLRYLTSSRQRREKEYEGKSWYELVEADRMSCDGRRLTEMIPGTLVGLLGSESDARTQGTVALQCMLDQFGDGRHSDMLLDGPTDTAWLGHWHRYLASQHVSFHRGRLTGFRLAPGGGVVPEVEVSEGAVTFKPASPARPVFYVLALPLASREGVPGALELAEQFVDRCRAGAIECPRDFADLCDFAGHPSEAIQASLAGPVPIGPLRHLSGIQYFFAQQLRLWRSHTQYLDAPAGLTAIAQPQFWSDPRNLLTGYRSVLSVDIGTFWPPERDGHPIPGTSRDPRDYPWGKTHRELADLVWAQLVAAHGGDFPCDTTAQMPRPAAFHVDENLVMRPPRPGAEPVVSGNRSPYLVNLKGQFRRRPGLAAPASSANGWKAQIGYHVAAGQYVLAGTHMQTYTRITSMESACESARHAVNALLTYLELPGEHCAIFDPEDHEPDLFELAKELDDRLCTQNARHPLG